MRLYTVENVWLKYIIIVQEYKADNQKKTVTHYNKCKCN